MNPQTSYRAQTRLIVSMLPGIHLRRLQKLLGASFSTTRYHVKKLEEDGEIVRSKDGGHDRLYPAGTGEEMKAVYAALQNKNARKVLRALVDDSSELTNGDIFRVTSLPKSTVSECVALLVGTSLVRRSLTVEGRIVYGVTRREEATTLLATFQRNLLNVATDRFIDLWDL